MRFDGLAQPALRPAGPAGKRIRRLKACPTRPGEHSWTCSQSGVNWIPFNIAANPFKFLLIPHQVVVTLVLPERSATTQNLVRATSGEALQRTHPIFRINKRCHKQMDVVRHHHEGVQLITPKPVLPVLQATSDQCGNGRLLQEQRPCPGSVQQPVHRNECFSARQFYCREHAIGRQGPRQAKGHEERLSQDMPMRKPAGVLPHSYLVGITLKISQLVGRAFSPRTRFPAGPTGRKAGGV